MIAIRLRYPGLLSDHGDRPKILPDGKRIGVLGVTSAEETWDLSRQTTCCNDDLMRRWRGHDVVYCTNIVWIVLFQPLVIDTPAE